jgi:hypothetical protein
MHRHLETLSAPENTPENREKHEGVEKSPLPSLDTTSVSEEEFNHILTDTGLP